MQKKNVYEWNYLKLGTYNIHSLEALLVHMFRFFENVKFGGFFFAKKNVEKNL